MPLYTTLALFHFYTFLLFAIQRILTLISVIGCKYGRRKLKLNMLNMKVTYLSTNMSTLLVANEHATG